MADTDVDTYENTEEILVAASPDNSDGPTKMCSVLKIQVPLMDFPSKGNVSIKAECAIEALQKRLKAS